MYVPLTVIHVLFYLLSLKLVWILCTSYCDTCAVLSSLFEARVDIAGGWTDTPPQAYEQGGAVVTLAIKINDEVSKFSRI